MTFVISKVVAFDARGNEILPAWRDKDLADYHIARCENNWPKASNDEDHYGWSVIDGALDSGLTKAITTIDAATDAACARISKLFGAGGVL